MNPTPAGAGSGQAGGGHRRRRLLVLGATGYVGGVVTEHMAGAGHEVLGGARSAAAAQALTGCGIRAVPADLTDPAGLARQAAAVEGVIVAAASGSFAVDRRAVSALLDAYAGTGKLLLLTSGSAVVADLGTRAAPGDLDPAVWSETDRPPPPPAMAERAGMEDLVVGAASRGCARLSCAHPWSTGAGGASRSR